MKKRFIGVCILLFCVSFLPVTYAQESAASLTPAAEANSSTPWWKDKVKFSGLWLSTYTAQKNTYSNKNVNASFFENTMRLGVKVSPTDKLDFNYAVIGEVVGGHAAKYTGVRNHTPLVSTEFANVKIKEILDQPLDLQVGRQRLEFGDGFLLHDFHTHKRTALTGFNHSLNAGRLTYTAKPFTIDLFGGRVDENYKSYEAFYYNFKSYMGRRDLYGSNIHWDYTESGTWDLLFVYKKDRSALASNTVALSNRIAVPVLKSPFDFTLVGEAVPQIGTTNVNSNYLDTVKHDRKAFGGHGDAIAGFDVPLKPKLKFSYIYFSGDNSKTKTNEGYDPMFYGFKDWDNWQIGSINSSNLFNTNERVFLYEGAIHPTAKTKMRLSHKQFYLNSPIYNYPYPVHAGKKFARETNLVFDWNPKEWLFCGFELGYLHPQRAGKAFNAGVEDTKEVILFMMVGF